MKYYVCYEDGNTSLAEGYDTMKLAKEYKEHAKAEGHKNVVIKSETEIKKLGYKSF